MSEFNTTLLREKFVITDAASGDMSDKPPLIALSNRLAIPVSTRDGRAAENFVVRAQNMHTALRFGATIVKEFQDNGPLMGRKKPFDWEAAYLILVKGYEKKWNPQRWVAVYHKGRIVFESGEGQRHPFLDIIEQCDARNADDYEKSLEIAKDAFRQAGKLVNIEHDTNVAMVMNLNDRAGRVGIILRGPSRTTTFNFTAKPKAGRDVKISQCLTVAAAFLEGIQLAFLVGMTNGRIKHGLIDKASDDGRKGTDAGLKLGRLNAAVLQFQNLLEVTYRPDPPNFPEMIDEAEKFAEGIIADELLRRSEEEEEKGNWVK